MLIPAIPVSPTAPAARLSKTAQGPEAQVASRGPGLRETRPGWVGAPRRTQAPGPAEREAALALAEERPGPQRGTWGAATNDAPRAWVGALRELRVTPQVAPPTSGRSSASAGRTTRHPGVAVRQRPRTGVAESFGWPKPVGRLRKVRQRGVARVGWLCTCAATVSNRVRMRTLAAAA
jgi:hypothetical protein